MKTKFSMLTMVVSLAVPLSAQIRLNLDNIASKAKESAEVSLDASTLQLASGFLSSGKSDDSKMKDLLAGLKSITVRHYEFTQVGQYKLEDLQSFRSQLAGPGWSKIVSVNENNGKEVSEVYTKTEQGKTAGLAIINAEPKELSVVYIDGAIDLASLANLGGHLGIPAIPLPPAVPDQKNAPDQKKGKGKQ